MIRVIGWTLIGLSLAACLSATGPGGGAGQVLELRDTVTIGFRPYGVAMAGNTALVTLLDATTVQRFDLPSRTGQIIIVGSVPTGVAIDRNGTRALVTNQGDAAVGLIDLDAGRQTRSTPTGTPPFRVLWSASGQRAYLCGASDRVLAVDAGTGQILDTAHTISAANGMALVGDTLLVVSSVLGQLAWIDTRTMVEVLRIDGVGRYQDVVVRPDANRVYVAIESRPVIEIRALDTGALVDSILVPRPTFGLTLRPGTAELWAAHPGGAGPGGVSVIDASSGSVERLIPLGDPRRIAFDEAGRKGIISDQNGSIYFLRP